MNTNDVLAVPTIDDHRAAWTRAKYIMRECFDSENHARVARDGGVCVSEASRWDCPDRRELPTLKELLLLCRDEAYARRFASSILGTSHEIQAVVLIEAAAKSLSTTTLPCQMTPQELRELAEMVGNLFKVVLFLAHQAAKP